MKIENMLAAAFRREVTAPLIALRMLALAELLKEIKAEAAIVALINYSQNVQPEIERSVRLYAAQSRIASASFKAASSPSYKRPNRKLHLVTPEEQNLGEIG